MSADKLIDIKTEIEVDYRFKNRIRSALMTVWELGAVDPDSSLANKNELINEIVEDLFRDFTVVNECGAV